ncbi:hypothetical protein OH687_32000 [Burkholderia anthina]|nr:hypothetical protein OH687_32000 [Burkholderia anthina]
MPQRSTAAWGEVSVAAPASTRVADQRCVFCSGPQGEDRH